MKSLMYNITAFTALCLLKPKSPPFPMGHN